MYYRARPSSRPSTHGRPPASITWMQLLDVSMSSRMSHSLCAWAAQTKWLETPATGLNMEDTTQQRIQWGQLTRVQMAHQRDEGDESRGVPSSTHGPWVLWNRLTSCHEHRLASQVLATTGAILWRPCPCRASAADARSEKQSRCGGDLVFPRGNTSFFFKFKSVY